MKLSFRNTAAFACAFAFALITRTTSGEPPWDAVDKALGQTGKSLPGDVHRYGWPRRDLEVTMGDVRVEPALALGSWAGFKMASEGHAMAMGDLLPRDTGHSAAHRAEQLPDRTDGDGIPRRLPEVMDVLLVGRSVSPFTIELAVDSPPGGFLT